MDFSFPVLVLLASIPACAVLFVLTTPVRACTIALMFSWLFLPMATLRLPGLPDVTKMMSASLGIFLGMVLFHPGMFQRFRFGLGELFLGLFIVGTGVTSVLNELGVWDGTASIMSRFLDYGVPFIFGRIVLQSAQDRWEAARIVVGFAAVYGLLAAWEWRMSPQLHSLVYGFYPQQQAFMIAARWGFYRPILFFPANLALGMFFAWTTLLAWWMFARGQLGPMAGLPAVTLVGLTAMGLLTSMSFGPWGLTLGGAGLLWIWSRTRAQWIVLLPALFAIGWMATRYTGSTSGTWLTDKVAFLSEQRSASLQYRIDAENILLEHAKLQPYFGWGGWGRNRVYDDQGQSVTAVDGLWIIYLGMYGLVGLSLFYLWWCWPLVLSALARHPVEREAAVMALVVSVAIQSCDLIFNAFLSPPLTFACGGVVACLTTSESPATLAARRPTVLSATAVAR